ncbi:MAG: Wzz/FepE/Etk N-terminal domain-containing protein, partial [Candidatus Methanoperedens sp.]
MEREIVEDEIDLRDYLNVIWKNRRLILAVFLISLISSGFYSFFVLQDEYQTESKLSYIPNQKISLTDAVEDIKSQSISKIATQEGEVSQALSVLSNMKVENIKNTNQILLQVKGNNPELMSKYFGIYIKVASDELNRKALEKSQDEYSKLDNLSILYAKQTEEINAKMKKKLVEEADLELKRLENQAKIYAKFGSVDKQIDLEFKISDMKSIKEGRAPSSVAQQMILSNTELILLNSQLTSINSKRVDLEIKKLEFENNGTQVVELITPPTDPVVTGPKRTLNIAIASVLGLFVGVF